jgi:DNA-binding response OmpR family regulator
MDEARTLTTETASEGYDATDRPFDFVGEGGETALICEPDTLLRDKIGAALRERGYQVITPATGKEALKAMRFHVFDLVVLNELFDAADPKENMVFKYLENLAMATRRRTFVALLSSRYRTMDNMAAFNQSVNLVINLKNVHELAEIIKQGVAENRAFYHVFLETMAKMGKA